MLRKNALMRLTDTLAFSALFLVLPNLGIDRLPLCPPPLRIVDAELKSGPQPPRRSQLEQGAIENLMTLCAGGHRRERIQSGHACRVEAIAP